MLLQFEELQHIYGPATNFQYMIIACGNVTDRKGTCSLATYARASHPALVGLVGQPLPDGNIKCDHNTTSAMYAACHVSKGNETISSSR